MQICWHGYMNSTGYSIASQDYLLSMLHHDPDINLRVIPQSNFGRSGMSRNRYQRFLGLTRRLEEKNAIHVYHTIPHLYRTDPRSSKTVGLCLFETINVPKEWVGRMNRMDAIITASEFNKGVFQTSGVEKPIHVVPHCFDPSQFNKYIQPVGRYRMKTIFACGTWKQRKNWDALIKAFYDGFEKKDNVCLLIKTDKPKQLHAMVVNIKRRGEWRSKDTAPIYSEEKTVCEFEEIPRIMRKGDVYISSSLGEGFGLPGMHAMALGMPVATVRFGGALEYARPELCTYIEPGEYKRRPTMDGIPQFRNCIWPVVRINELRDKMKQLVKEQDDDKVERAYEYVHSHFNYDVVGRKLLEIIDA